jgi:hypothetical protein
MDEDKRAVLSRRQIVGSVGAGIAVGVAGPAPTAENRADRESRFSSEHAMPTIEDRRSKYPKPPFKQQTQPWPGLARDMDPVPDHGERSYRGSGRLQGRKALIKAALAHLKPGSCIIGTTSEQAYDPSPDLYDYAQTEAATMNYVKSLAKQLGAKGIRVNGVAPGPIWTPLQISGGAPEQKYEKFGSTTVFGRPGQPAELASIFVQLAADDGSFATWNIYGSGGGQGQP